MKHLRYFGWLIVLAAVSPFALLTTTPTWALGSISAVAVLLGYGVAWVRSRRQAAGREEPRDGHTAEVP